jgi:hypothetical protein
MVAEFRQEQATLRIKERKSGDLDKKVNSFIKKAESNITCAESIKEKEVLLITGTNEKNNDSDNKCNSVIEKAESNSTSAEFIMLKEDDKALGSHPKVKQAIVHITQPSCSPNIFEEVCLASDLPIF